MKILKAVVLFGFTRVMAMHSLTAATLLLLDIVLWNRLSRPLWIPLLNKMVVYSDKCKSLRKLLIYNVLRSVRQNESTSWPFRTISRT